MRNLNFLLCCGVIALPLLMSGCAREISSSAYDAQTIGAANTAYECVVVRVRKVRIQEGDYLRDNATGAIMGAVAGGALGHTIGKGSGNTLATVAGATAGAFGGAYAERSLSRQEAFEYTVKLTSGELRTVVQGLDSPLYVGQQALLVIDQRGRSRVTAK